MCVLDGANTWSLIRPGHESSVGSAQFIRRWGLLRESAPGTAHWCSDRPKHAYLSPMLYVCCMSSLGGVV